jgi:hypothetical protein
MLWHLRWCPLNWYACFYHDVSTLAYLSSRSLIVQYYLLHLDWVAVLPELHILKT